MAFDRWIDASDKFVQALVNRTSLDQVASTGISVERITVLSRRESVVTPIEAWDLIGFAVNNRFFDLLASHGVVPPSFDLRKPFDLEDLRNEIPVGSEGQVPAVRGPGRALSLAGYHVNFPLGVSASVLMANSSWIEFYARRGFDVLTYKTVRSVERAPHAFPNWVFLRDPGELTPITAPKAVSSFDQRVIGEVGYWPHNPDLVSMANSFGVPSTGPDWWMADVAKAKNALSPGQVLIVSVTASSVASPEAIRDDFVQTALLAKKAGAQIVEANYSCPNVPGDPVGEVYQSPEWAGEISAAIARALGDTPLFVKIGYLPEGLLSRFFAANKAHVRGIVAINTVSAPVITPSGDELFPGRERAGVSGRAIRERAEEVTRNLVRLREQSGLSAKELAILSVGGVLKAEDVYDYLDLGADIVESCTGSFLNPNLALEARLLPTGVPLSLRLKLAGAMFREALLHPLIRSDFELDRVRSRVQITRA